MQLGSSDGVEENEMNNITKLGTLAVVALGLMAPMSANAQSKKQRQREIARREKTKSDWQKTANTAAVVAILGQLNKDKTVSYLAGATALYSAYRMEEDRKSSDRSRRELAARYSRPYYTYKGVRYDRKSVRKNGKLYYTFVRNRR